MLTPEGLVYSFIGVTLWVTSAVLWVISIVLVWPWISDNVVPWLKHGLIRLRERNHPIKLFPKALEASEALRVSLEFYDKGDEDHCYIKVINNDSTQRLSVRGRVLEFRDPKKRLNPRIFHVPWESQGDSKQYTEIRNGDFANLLIATFHDEDPKKPELKIRKLGTLFCETQWSNDDSQRLRPAYRLLLQFHGNKGREADFSVWVYPETREGPLRVSYDPPDIHFPKSKTPDVELTPTAAIPDQRLTITNRGSYGEFFAKARVLQVRNDPNPHGIPTSPFVLRWVDHERRETEIAKDDSDSLLIGNHQLWVNQNLGQINLFELGRPLDRPVWTCRWNMPTEKLPECDIEIKVFQKRLDRPKVKRFTFRPRSDTGGIEMIPLAESDLGSS